MKPDETMCPLDLHGFVHGTKMFHLTLPDTGGLRVNGTIFQTEFFTEKFHGTDATASITA
jgi:hypothetical protein